MDLLADLVVSAPRGYEGAAAQGLLERTREAGGAALAQERVVQAVIEQMERSYPDEGVARAVIEALRAYEHDGLFARLATGEELAMALTTLMRDVSGDVHLEVVYDVEFTGPVAVQDNCGFEKVEMLAGNIGYVKLNFFAPLPVCRRVVVAAMDYLGSADAVVFDLRDNRGGEPEMVMLLAGYLFDHPRYIYNPRENTTRQSWTTPVAESRLGDKPVYLLTSERTASAAEQFAYNLKMLRRAAVVGETTSGRAHAGVFHRIGERFGLSIREATPIHPYGEKDWEGTGVTPHVSVDEEMALERALKLAASRLGR